ncbi:hypothetical protein [Mycobacterium saskatchewanense]|nr:hypothetical protein [Mycobacterium saskatchewanense]
MSVPPVARSGFVAAKSGPTVLSCAFAFRRKPLARAPLHILVDESLRGRRLRLETYIAEPFSAIKHDRLMAVVAELVLAFFSGKRTNHERSFGLSASAHRRTDHCGLMSRSSRNRRVIAQAVDKPRRGKPSTGGELRR